MDADTPAVAEEGDEERGEESGAVARLVDDQSSRRRFLRMVGGTAGASAFATLASACGRQKPVGISQRQAGTVGNFGPGDTGIVNYALFLEYIEGDFYERLVKGDEIRDRRQRDFFKQIRENEAEHRNVLDRVADQIGRPLEKPKTKFKRIFDGGPKRILSFAATLENLGSAAYLGQAARIIDREILASALSIHTVEARQAAALNELAGRSFQTGSALKGSIPDGPFAKPMNMQQVLRHVRPYYVGSIPTLRPPTAGP